MSSHEIVAAATQRLFNDKDVSAVDDLFGPVYIQHSALAPDGLDGLRGLVSRLTDANGYQLVRVIADDRLAVTEGVFTGFAPVPLVGFDLWRIEDGRIVEHWDALGPLAAAQTSPTDSEETAGPDTDPAGNAALVTRVVDGLIGGAASEQASAGAAGVSYVRLHAVIADRDLVYTRSEGVADGPVIVNDVWRIHDGRIVERWGLVAAVPAALPHANGAF